MKVFVPTIGTEMELIKPCKVLIFGDGGGNATFLKRLGISWDWTKKEELSISNEALMKKFGVKIGSISLANGKSFYAEVTLPTSIVLKVKRVYIRNGKGFEDYDSITFSCDGKKIFPDGIFWLKLEAVNRLEIKTPDDISNTHDVRKKKSLENQMKACQKIVPKLEVIKTSAKSKGLTYEDYIFANTKDRKLWWAWNLIGNKEEEKKHVNFLIKHFKDLEKALRAGELTPANAKAFEKDFLKFGNWINEQKGK